MTKVITIRNGIKVSERTHVKLKVTEVETLKEFVDRDPAAYTTINLNTGIAQNTIKAGIERGWFEAAHALKLRAFLKAINDLTI